MSFANSSLTDSSKTFFTRKSDVSNRWDPFYFRPALVSLEEKIRRVAAHNLRHFVRRMSGGATPSTRDADVHYTEDADGVPFIRVQNLSTTGTLNLDDCKRITRTTHEGLLSRSRLKGGELLIKITGVGRMAIASVVPENFEGNINQHIVAIRTESIKTSEILAAYLNLDIAERLASRRSTGGTRPALDYPALLSIPIVFDERIRDLMATAVQGYEERLAKAKLLLNEIDERLLNALRLSWEIEQPHAIENRIFRTASSEVTGERFDPRYHRPDYRRLREVISDHQHARLSEVVTLSHELWDQETLFTETFPYVEIGAIDLVLGRIKAAQNIPVPEAASRARMIVRTGDLLVSLTRPTRRAVAFIPDELPLAVASNGFAVVRHINEARLQSRFLFHLLRSRLCVAQFDQRSSGGNYPAITEEQLLRLLIPLPELTEQAKIAALLDQQYDDVSGLLRMAEDEIQTVKDDIQTMILTEAPPS